jgi:hypothetical protein
MDDHRKYATKNMYVAKSPALLYNKKQFTQKNEMNQVKNNFLEDEKSIKSSGFNTNLSFQF